MIQQSNSGNEKILTNSKSATFEPYADIMARICDNVSAGLGKQCDADLDWEVESQGSDQELVAFRPDIYLVAKPACKSNKSPLLAKTPSDKPEIAPAHHIDNSLPPVLLDDTSTPAADIDWDARFHAELASSEMLVDIQQKYIQKSIAHYFNSKAENLQQALTETMNSPEFALHSLKQLAGAAAELAQVQTEEIGNALQLQELPDDYEQVKISPSSAPYAKFIPSNSTILKVDF